MTHVTKTYGYQYVPLLLSLASVSLITQLPLPKPLLDKAPPPPPPPPFAPIRKSLRLLSETDETSPTDISYVYSAYAPLSLRLVQCVAQKSAVLSSSDIDSNVAGGNAPVTPAAKAFASPITGWKGFEDAVKTVPGATVDITQRSDGTSSQCMSCSITRRLAWSIVAGVTTTVPN